MTRIALNEADIGTVISQLHPERECEDKRSLWRSGELEREGENGGITLRQPHHIDSVRDWSVTFDERAPSTKHSGA